MASRTVQLARKRAWQVREIQCWLWTAARRCTARDLRAAAHMVDLARQLTGLPHR